jgi:hypothetical protein
VPPSSAAPLSLKLLSTPHFRSQAASHYTDREPFEASTTSISTASTTRQFLPLPSARLSVIRCPALNLLALPRKHHPEYSTIVDIIGFVGEGLSTGRIRKISIHAKESQSFCLKVNRGSLRAESSNPEILESEFPLLLHGRPSLSFTYLASRITKQRALNCALQNARVSIGKRHR